MTAPWPQTIGGGNHVKHAELCSDYCVFSAQPFDNEEFRAAFPTEEQRFRVGTCPSLLLAMQRNDGILAPPRPRCYRRLSTRYGRDRGIIANQGKDHGAVRTASRVAGMGTEAEIGQDRRHARPIRAYDAQRSAVLRLRAADPHGRSALGRSWRPAPLALRMRRAGGPHMVMGLPPGHVPSSRRGDGLTAAFRSSVLTGTAAPPDPARASSRPRR